MMLNEALALQQLDREGKIEVSKVKILMNFHGAALIYLSR